MTILCYIMIFVIVAPWMSGTIYNLIYVIGQNGNMINILGNIKTIGPKLVWHLIDTIVDSNSTYQKCKKMLEYHSRYLEK